MKPAQIILHDYNVNDTSFMLTDVYMVFDQHLEKSLTKICFICFAIRLNVSAAGEVCHITCGCLISIDGICCV